MSGILLIVATFQTIIISAWIDAEKEYEKLGFDKGRKLNIAVWLIALSLVCITFRALIKTIWGE